MVSRSKIGARISRGLRRFFAARKAAGRAPKWATEPLLAVTGKVSVSYDSGRGTEFVLIPFSFSSDAGPRPSDGQMRELAKAAALTALEEWAEFAHPRYVMSASWSAKTIHYSLPATRDLPATFPEITPRDSDWWQWDEDIPEGEDGYIMPRSLRFHKPAREEVPA